MAKVLILVLLLASRSLGIPVNYSEFGIQQAQVPVQVPAQVPFQVPGYYIHYSIIPIYGGLQDGNNSIRERQDSPNPITNPIGAIISLIPFLPISINVPDMINGVISGVSGIVGGIGQRFPIFFGTASTPTTPPPATPEMMVTSPEITVSNSETSSPIINMPEIRRILPGPMPMGLLIPISYRQGKENEEYVDEK